MRFTSASAATALLSVQLGGPQQLLIRVEGRAQRDELLAFLRGRACEATAEGKTMISVDDCGRRPPGLATLVALVEEWRSAARVPEAVLELGERRTILRTEA